MRISIVDLFRRGVSRWLVGACLLAAAASAVAVMPDKYELNSSTKGYVSNPAEACAVWVADMNTAYGQSYRWTMSWVGFKKYVRKDGFTFDFDGSRSIRVVCAGTSIKCVKTLSGGICGQWEFYSDMDTRTVAFGECPLGTGFSEALQQCVCANGSEWAPVAGKCVPVHPRNKDESSGQCRVRLGHPIHPLTGSKTVTVELGNWLGVPITITYDTRRKLPAVGGDVAYGGMMPPMFDGMWESNLHKQLFVGGNAVTVFRGQGHWRNFDSKTGTTYRSSNTELVDRVVESSAWIYYDQAALRLETYNGMSTSATSGLLQRVQTADARLDLGFTYDSSSLSYNAVAKLAKVADRFGRSFQFTYAQYGDGALRSRIETMIDPLGKVTRFVYDDQHRLSQIVWPDQTKRTFLYERADLAWALTGVIDEEGKRVVTYAYDAQGYAIDTQAAGGATHYSASWTRPPQWAVTQTWDPVAQVIWRDIAWQEPQGLVVTTPNNETVNYGVTNVNGVPRVTSVSQPAGSGCLASTSEREYDSRGNVTRNDDFSGARTCYAYDATRNLELARVEGLDKTADCAAVLASNAVLPAGARKITTQWHPNWPLRTRVYEPKRITTSVYYGQTDPIVGGKALCQSSNGWTLDNDYPAIVCKQVEQATTDANGAAGAAPTLDATVATRTWTYTYDNYGRLLIAKDPLGNQTTNAYYTTTTADYKAGADLQSTTNAVGHKTTFNRYDAAGRVVTLTDPNGNQTDLSYDDRGRIATAITASRITSYGYDKVGRLIAVTHPDGSKTGMGYDDAGRLTSATDTRGNKVTYELDGSGNVVKQDIADPAGVLRRSIRQSFDALGRLQGMTLSDR